MKSAIEWISVAKGIGIFLVVVGHFHPEGSPAYWTHINRIIYQFHMPLFFLLSGYLYVHGKYAYWEMLASKVKRLGYPFVSIAAIFFLIKWMAGNWFSLQHAITVDSLIVLLTNPAQSYMPLLWFVHALFLMFILYPLLRLKLGNWVIMICFLGINVFWGSDFPVIGRMVAYMPFFVAGVMLREQTLPMQELFSRNALVLAGLTAGFALTSYLVAENGVVESFGYLAKLFLGVCGTMIVIGLSRRIVDFSGGLAWVLGQMGIYSMSIYLLHTLFESAVRIGFFQILKNAHLPFEIVAALAVASGVIFPLLIEKRMLRNYSVTKKYLLGMA